MTSDKKKRKKKESPPTQAEQPAPVEEPRQGWGVIKLDDLVPEHRPLEINGKRYNLLHPAALSLYDVARVDKLRRQWQALYKKWNADGASRAEIDQLDELATELVPLVTDIPRAVVRKWRWQMRFRIIMLHFGFIVEVLPNLQGASLLSRMALPNRAARRRAERETKGRTSGGSSQRSAIATI